MMQQKRHHINESVTSPFPYFLYVSFPSSVKEAQKIEAISFSLICR